MGAGPEPPHSTLLSCIPRQKRPRAPAGGKTAPPQAERAPGVHLQLEARVLARRERVRGAAVRGDVRVVAAHGGGGAGGASRTAGAPQPQSRAHAFSAGYFSEPMKSMCSRKCASPCGRARHGSISRGSAAPPVKHKPASNCDSPSKPLPQRRTNARPRPHPRRPARWRAPARRAGPRRTPHTQRAPRRPCVVRHRRRRRRHCCRSRSRRRYRCRHRCRCPPHRSRRRTRRRLRPHAHENTGAHARSTLTEHDASHKVCARRAEADRTAAAVTLGGAAAHGLGILAVMAARVLPRRPAAPPARRPTVAAAARLLRLGDEQRGEACGARASQRRRERGWVRPRADRRGARTPSARTRRSRTHGWAGARGGTASCPPGSASRPGPPRKT